MQDAVTQRITTVSTPGRVTATLETRSEFCVHRGDERKGFRACPEMSHLNTQIPLETRSKGCVQAVIIQPIIVRAEGRVNLTLETRSKAAGNIRAGCCDSAESLHRHSKPTRKPLEFSTQAAMI